MYKISLRFLVYPVKGLRRQRTSSNNNISRLDLKTSSSSKNNNYGSWDFDQSTPDIQQQHQERRPTLVVDDELLSIAGQLMRHVQSSSHHIDIEETDPDYARHLAAVALAAVEANGAIPPLSAAQRQAFQLALEEVARHLSTSSMQVDNTIATSSAEDSAHWFELSEEGGDEIIIKPEFRNLLEQVSNLKLQGGWNEGDVNADYDSVAQGGEIGNISLPHGHSSSVPQDTHKQVVVAPAEGGTERTQHAVEDEFMNLEVGAFEPHADDVGPADHGTVKGDAPGAGGGLQIEGDTEEEAN